MSLLGETNADELLRDIAHQNVSEQRLLDPFLSHSLETGRIAKELASAIGLDTHFAYLTGLFHDIGRLFCEDQKHGTYHEIVGAEYIEHNGVEIGISTTQQDCTEIAQSVRSHFVVHEQFCMPEYQSWRQGLEHVAPGDLLPGTWNEAIVVYADMTNINGKRTSFEERLEQIKQNRSHTRVGALGRAEPRLTKLKTDVEQALASGSTDDSKYSILR
jgi:putative nucleotidyltransferase with HDIG domain